MVQQIAFGVAQMQEILTTSKVTTAFVKIAVGGSFLLEIAKLRAFRRLFSELYPTLPFHLIAEVSHRGKCSYHSATHCYPQRNTAQRNVCN